MVICKRFKYFSKIYNNEIDWSLYSYLKINGTLSMISIPHKNKDKILSNLVHSHTFIKDMDLPKAYIHKNDKHSPLVHRDKKLLYLVIPKNCCTYFKTLFYGINMNISHGLNRYIFQKDIKYLC